MEQLDSHWTDFHEIWYLRIFRKSVEKIEVSLNRTWRPIYIFLLYLAHFFLEWEMFQTHVVEKIQTHILCSVSFFFLPENRAFREMWKTAVGRGRPQMTIWRMLIASCWILRLRMYTLRLCNTHCFSTATVFARTRLNVASYVRCLSCVGLMSWISSTDISCHKTGTVLASYAASPSPSFIPTSSPRKFLDGGKWTVPCLHITDHLAAYAVVYLCVGGTV